MRRRRESPSERMRTGRRATPARAARAGAARVCADLSGDLPADGGDRRIRPAVHGAQTLQSAVDQAARETVARPLTPTATFADGACRSSVINGVYDPNYLAINISGMQPVQSDSWISSPRREITLPSVNQALLPMMFNDTVGGTPLLRYPGRVGDQHHRRPRSRATAVTVAVPIVTSVASPGGRRPSNGTTCWKRIRTPAETAPSASRRRPPSGTSSGGDGGGAAQLPVRGGDDGRLSTASRWTPTARRCPT